MKNQWHVFLLFVLILSLVGCGESKTYEQAIEQYKLGEYDKATELFSEIIDYEDSEKYISFINTFLSFEDVLNKGQESTYFQDVCNYTFDEYEGMEELSDNIAKCEYIQAYIEFQNGNTEEYTRLAKEANQGTSNSSNISQEVYNAFKKREAELFAGKLLTACSSGFNDPTSIKLKGVWYYSKNDAIDSNSFETGEEISNEPATASFTYQFDVKGDDSITKEVYYGVNSIVMEDSNIKYTQFIFLESIFLESAEDDDLQAMINNLQAMNFVEDETYAKQEGIELDHIAVQEYFDNNV